MFVQLTIIVAGAFLGAVANGAAGFAFVIIVTIFWVHVLPPIQIVTLAAACAQLFTLRAFGIFASRLFLIGFGRS